MSYNVFKFFYNYLNNKSKMIVEKEKGIADMFVSLEELLAGILTHTGSDGNGNLPYGNDLILPQLPDSLKDKLGGNGYLETPQWMTDKGIMYMSDSPSQVVVFNAIQFVNQQSNGE